MTSCERDLQSLYALASSNRSIPSSVSRARKPSPVVLSTLGIGNRNHSTRKKAARIAQILPPIRPSHTPCSPRRPARATVSRTALAPPYVPDITARSALDRVRRSLRSSGSLDEVSISRSSCRPWGRSVPRAPGGPVDLDRHPAGGGPRLDQLERRVRAGVGEQTRALADDHGEDQEVHLVDKVVGEQPPDQVAAAVHLQLPFLLGFQLADGGRDVEERGGPAAAVESAAAVLVRSAAPLHHAVDGDERRGRQLHGRDFLSRWFGRRSVGPGRTDLIGLGTVRAAIAAGSPVWDSLIGSRSRQRG